MSDASKRRAKAAKARTSMQIKHDLEPLNTAMRELHKHYQDERSRFEQGYQTWQKCDSAVSALRMSYREYHKAKTSTVPAANADDLSRLAQSFDNCVRAVRTALSELVFPQDVTPERKTWARNQVLNAIKRPFAQVHQNDS
jgi:hypothetical protein